MGTMAAPIGGDTETVACPNRGNRRVRSAVGARRDRGGPLLATAGSGQREIVHTSPVRVADTMRAPAAMVTGCGDGVNNRNGATHHVSTAVPAEPMPPIADGLAGSETDEPRAMSGSAVGAHSAQGRCR